MRWPAAAVAGFIEAAPRLPGRRLGEHGRSTRANPSAEVTLPVCKAAPQNCRADAKEPASKISAALPEPPGPAGVSGKSMRTESVDLGDLYSTDARKMIKTD